MLWLETMVLLKIMRLCCDSGHVIVEDHSVVVSNLCVLVEDHMSVFVDHGVVVVDHMTGCGSWHCG